jgi:hypothetical protein
MMIAVAAMAALRAVLLAFATRAAFAAVFTAETAAALATSTATAAMMTSAATAALAVAFETAFVALGARLGGRRRFFARRAFAAEEVFEPAEETAGFFLFGERRRGADLFLESARLARFTWLARLTRFAGFARLASFTRETRIAGLAAFARLARFARFAAAVAVAPETFAARLAARRAVGIALTRSLGAENRALGARVSRFRFRVREGTAFPALGRARFFFRREDVELGLAGRLGEGRRAHFRRSGWTGGRSFGA